MESANIVGYANISARKDYNFYTPCFERVDGSACTIQDIQLSESVEDMSADLQVLDGSRKTIGEAYAWLSAATAASFGLEIPEGCGAWVDGSFALPEIDPLQAGQVVQVGVPAATDTFKSSGQVSDADALINGRANYNFVGNPFPVALSIQNIQCAATVEDMSADLQILDGSRKTIGEAYAWLSAATAASFGLEIPEGCGAWVDGSFALPEVDSLQAGSGVQVGLPMTSDISVLCHYEM